MIHVIYPIVILVILYYVLEYFVKPPTVSDKYPDIATIKESIAFCKDISEKYYDRICVHLDDFFKLYQDSFIYDKTDQGIYDAMYCIKGKISKTFMELKYLMENDLEKEIKLESARKNLAYIVTVYIEDVRSRGKIPFVVKESIQDYYYRKHVSAVNDFVV